MLIKSQINFKGILIWKNEAEPSDKKQKKLIVRDGKINVSESAWFDPEEVTNKIITSLRQNIDKSVGTPSLDQAKKSDWRSC